MRALVHSSCHWAAIGATVMVAACLVAACGPGLSPAPPATVPAPAPLPAPRVDIAPAGVRYRLPPVLERTGYAVSRRTELQRDSAGRSEQETLESSARVELSLRRDPRGGLTGAGRVDSFVVRPSGASTRSTAPVPKTTTVPAPLFTSVAIDAVLDSLSIRAIVRPPLANECDRAEAAAAGVARDLLVRVPETVTVGDRWRDSLVTLVCRGGVPMTLRTVIESTLAGISDGSLQVRRTLLTTVEGSSRMPWRQTSITGEGRGTQTALIDLQRGTLIGLDGEDTLTLHIANGSARDGTRSETMTQRSVLTVRAVRP